MVVRFFPFTLFHAKKDAGSTRIRVDNLIKYWPEAEVYKYGQKTDVMIFQKVYVTHNVHVVENYPAIKILDICDMDWNDSPGVYIKASLDAVDAVVVPTEALRKFLQQMTSKPVKIIKDRFDISEFPTPKVHKGEAKNLVWFGYAQNTEVLKLAIPSIERRGLNLTIISNEDPHAYRWGSPTFERSYKFIKYDQTTIYDDLQKHDICILPKGFRLQDRFKSENKTVIAQLCGLPVAINADDLDRLKDAQARNDDVQLNYETVKKDYDCKLSVSEYQDLINEVKTTRR